MLFQSKEYALLFLATFSLYAILKRRAQNLLLLLVSLIFYGWWDVRYLALFLITVTAVFIAGNTIAKLKTEAHRTWVLSLALVYLLCVLVLFKYYDFFVESVAFTLAEFDITVEPRYLRLVLPLGISFYTFQSIGYLMDVYRSQSRAVSNFPEFALFISFFPQVTAGPIHRCQELHSQITKDRQLSFQNVSGGLFLGFYGYLKKVAIADPLGRIVDPVFENFGQAGIGEILIATLFFGFQIYCDFSGYTDMARGSAKILGFNLVPNFNSPYISSSPIVFWERWHMSLSRWFKDYLYYPLTLRLLRWKPGVFSQYLSHLITMSLIGLWHGAHLKFLVFGLFWGLWIIVYTKKRKFFTQFSPGVLIPLNFFMANIGWLLFRVSSLSDLLSLANPTFQFNLLPSIELIYFGVLGCLLVLALDYIQYRWPNVKARAQEIDKPVLVYLVVIFAVTLGLMAIVSRPKQNKDFIYFKF